MAVSPENYRKLRRYLALVLLVLVLPGYGWLLGQYSLNGDIARALIGLLYSVVVFSLLAFLTSDYVRWWKAVDYPWVCAAFIAIVFSLAQIHEGVLRQQFQDAQYWYQAGLSNFQMVARIVDANCNSRRDTLDPLQKPVCDALPDAVRKASQDLVRVEYPFPRNFEQNFPEDWVSAIVESLKKTTHLSPPENWEELLYWSDWVLNSRSSFREASTSNEVISKSFLQSIVNEYKHLWYVILAFFVGLRISKTTAEIFQSRNPLAPRVSGQGSRMNVDPAANCEGGADRFPSEATGGGRHD